MIILEQKKLIIENMIELLELPESAYEKAIKRYEDIGSWLSRDDSSVYINKPHIFPQGSFRLGTAIRPLNDNEEYDVDLSCKLREGITHVSHTQEFLKSIVGRELEAYRVSRGIKEALEEKHRCWRLEYQDDLSFHMDIVPCIPADESTKKKTVESMRKFGLEESMANSASQTAVYITDNRRQGYRRICCDWKISNPEGYAHWFEYRMDPQRLKAFQVRGQVDNMPLYKRKTPLQRAIQLLKRHRDQMFKGNEDLKPISIIITTLAARAYTGEQNVFSALQNILKNMGQYVNKSTPRIPNPVDPAEDFADRWGMEKYKNLNLEKNFWDWLKQAQLDFESITSTLDTHFITEQAQQKFSLKLNQSELSRKLGINLDSEERVTPKVHVISDPAKPWENG
ncbi:nucleotidyltransferase [Aminobacterium sp. MB27-C1]|uniref:nucleotidyltransferase domain-containing protein n=1 Tax=Aminobacterium sp. MB27-C1 TaxID=3070661 RepID=UPI0027DE5B51|nr:nucleotidyltransferase [Aminobacterium sp. MB27-C1]WMI72185.1 nucleotidyltransferase [Aminobacterium sp. MB27-C1]